MPLLPLTRDATSRSSVSRIGLGLSLLVLVAGAARAQAPPGAPYVGRTVTAVRVELEGREIAEPGIMDLVETRTGQPLSLAGVRESITRLFNLGRFQDLQVEATADGDGVRLNYVLVPLRAVERIVFRGTLGLAASRLRAALEERFGGTPTIGRATAAARALEDLYASAGYLRARVEPSAEASAAGRGTALAFDIDAGPRARIGELAVVGTPPVAPAQLLDRLDVRSGEYYDREKLDRGLGKYVADLRNRGYYEVAAEHTTALRDDGTVVDLTIDVRSGPLVSVSFEGDPLPQNRIAEFVPVAREGSVDEDLLEDSDRRIEEYLREQGYWRAAVAHRRTPIEGRLTIVFFVKKGDRVHVAEVAITGNRTVATSELGPLLRFKPGEPFVAARLDADVTAIEGYYRRLGYAQVRIDTSVEPEPADRLPPGGESVTPRVTIEEGPRTLVASIVFEGNQVVSEADLRGVMSTAPGQPYYEPQVAADRDAVAVLYLNRGYRSVQVQVAREFDQDRSSVALAFRIEEGPLSIVDHILIVGNTRTKTSTIEHELLLRPGDPLGLDALIESQRRLGALGLFRRVRMTELEHGSGTRRDLLVVVEEAPATTLGYGGGVEGTRRLRTNPEGGPAEERFEIAPRGFFEIGRRNLWGTNRSIDLFTRVSVRSSDDPNVPVGEDPSAGFKEYRVVGSYREPRAFKRNVSILASAFLEQGVRTSFNFNRQGFNTELSRPVTPILRLSGRYSVNYTRRFDERINPKDLSLIDRLFPTVRLSAFSVSALRDTRNDAVDPTRGSLAIVDGELALRAIGSEVGFAKTYLQGFVYRNLFGPENRRVVAALGARVGLATGFRREVEVRYVVDTGEAGVEYPPIVTPIDDVPASERFFAGGDTTVRGFTLDRLGTAATIDQNGFPKGGSGLIVLNAELRVQLRRGFGVVAFLDSGNVFARANDITLSELRFSPGLGLRYQSPIGPVRVDLGFKLDRQPWERRLTAFHFSFGQAF